MLTEYTTTRDILKKINKINLFFVAFLISLYIFFIGYVFYKPIEINFLTYPVYFITLIIADLIVYFYMKNISFKKDLDNCCKESKITIDNIDYQLIYIRKDGKITETRFFENGLLSHHKSKAIVSTYKDPWKKNEKYFYQGKIVEAKDDNEFIKIVKTIKSLKNFN